MGKKGKKKVPTRSAAVQQPTAGPPPSPKGKKKDSDKKPSPLTPPGGDATTPVAPTTVVARREEPLFSEVVKRRGLEKKREREREGSPYSGDNDHLPEGEYAAVMRRAQEEIPLKDLGITETLKSRPALTGAMLVKVFGPERKVQADRLAKRMTDLFADKPEIWVARPQKMGEIRVSGADPSATPKDIARAVAEQGGCPLTEVKVGDIKTTVRGTRTAWVRCPLEAATKIGKVGRLQIRWFHFKVKLLDTRPLQCHRCLEKGHVQAKCPAGNIDRSKCCYRCGTEGHEARACTAPVHCAICSAAGRPASYRMGGPACKTPKNGGRKIKGPGSFLADLCGREAGLDVVAEPYRVSDSNPMPMPMPPPPRAGGRGLQRLEHGGPQARACIPGVHSRSDVGFPAGCAVGGVLEGDGHRVPVGPPNHRGGPNSHPPGSAAPSPAEGKQTPTQIDPGEVGPGQVGGGGLGGDVEGQGLGLGGADSGTRPGPIGAPLPDSLKQTKTGGAPISETLDPEFLGQVVETLFPVRDVNIPPRRDPPLWNEDLEISKKELSEAAKRLWAAGKAPGPDEIPGRIWALAFGGVEACLRRLYNTCLRTGTFPSAWKKANLVLIHKEGKPAEQFSAYRPICLLDEVSKLFERIVAGRIVQHLSRNGPDLSEEQFEFREGRSTTDAILHLKALSDQIVGEEEVVLAVSLEIVNAFNSLPWDWMGVAMEHHGLLQYLRDVVWDYFRGRTLQHRDQLERVSRRPVNCGVPQGSVLGLLL
ncbi:uncharacterized protein [Linepithema humile]|uniref:uncharacterized protein n=1 Tax=Linepithema humile TaxID=83485 RepID=UPI00351DCAA1